MLKIVDRYIGKQVFSGTLIAVLVLTLVLVLGNLFKEIFELLVDKNLPLDAVLKFVAYILPYSLIFTVPWGFLTAVLLVFGRLSADNELISMRVAGLSMSRICRPVFLLAIALAGLSFWINTRVAPIAQGEMKRALVSMVKEDPLSFFEADKVVTEFSPNIIYAKEKEGQTLEGVEIVMLDASKRRISQYIRAETAVMAYNAKSENIELTLTNPATLTSVDEPDDPDAAEPTFHQELRPGVVMGLGNVNLSLAELNESVRLEKESMLPTDVLRRKLSEDTGLSAKRRCEIRTAIQKRYSFSMACITFALIAVPLGVTAQRRETSIGFALSLVIAVVYFLFIIMADTFSDTPGAFPYLLMWIPNVLFVSLGAFLFWRLSRR